MNEMSTEENERIVSSVYEAAMRELHAGRPVSHPVKLIHDVEHMMQEANSGASFEQYFRWASVDELATIRDHLRILDLHDVLDLLSEAIAIAFPTGVPLTDEDKSRATEWSPEQEAELSRLFGRLEGQNGRITNTLGAYARNSRL